MVVTPIVQLRGNTAALFIQHIGIERHAFVQQTLSHQRLQRRQKSLVADLGREVANMIERTEVHIVANPHFVTLGLLCSSHLSLQIALSTHGGGNLNHTSGRLERVVDNGRLTHTAYHATHTAVALASHEPNAQRHLDGRKPALIRMLTHIAVQRRRMHLRAIQKILPFRKILFGRAGRQAQDRQNGACDRINQGAETHHKCKYITVFSIS